MIQALNLSKHFDARGIAGIRGLDLQVNNGEILAILGANGSGKTTLLNLLAGKLKPDTGTVTLRGDIHFFTSIIERTEENVQKYLIRHVRKEMDEDKKLQLTRDLADIFEFTYQLRQNLSQLSQGQLQKVLMARELINSPDLIFMDEPFVHLDPMTRIGILESLFSFIQQRQITVLWITHERDEALRFADRLLLLQHGKIEQLGTPFELLGAPRNLFVAHFFGYHNFWHFKASEGKSPWGDWSLNRDEGYVVIPDDGWIVQEESPFRPKVESIFPQQTSSQFRLRLEEKEYQAMLPLKARELYRTGGLLPLAPIREKCLTIPL